MQISSSLFRPTVYNLIIDSFSHSVFSDHPLCSINNSLFTLPWQAFPHLRLFKLITHLVWNNFHPQLYTVLSFPIFRFFSQLSHQRVLNANIENDLFTIFCTLTCSHLILFNFFIYLVSICNYIICLYIYLLFSSLEYKYCMLGTLS